MPRNDGKRRSEIISIKRDEEGGAKICVTALAKSSGIEECVAVVGHLEGRPGRGVQQLLERLETSREFLMLLYDLSIPFLEVVDIFRCLGQDRALFTI